MNPGIDWGAWLWLAAPAVALLSACVALVPLGTQVLARGVVFIDLAVAQVAACGALAAALLIDHPGLWASSAATGMAALAGAAGVRWLAMRAPAQREALIGLVYVLAASAAVLAAASDPHGRERLATLLSADVLWAAWEPTLVLAVAAAIGWAIWRWARAQWRRDRVFYPLFALTLSAAVPALGLYLVFALLIGPALWTLRGRSVGAACGGAAVACAAGLAASAWLDWPSGACVAVSVTGLGLASAWSRPRSLPANGADRTAEIGS